jgi:hypothetical protein
MANDRKYCRTHGVYHDTFGDGCPRCRETEESTLRSLANTEYRATNPGEYECPHCRYVSLRREAPRCPLCHGSVHADYWSRVRAAEAAAQAEWDRGAPKREAAERDRAAKERKRRLRELNGQIFGHAFAVVYAILVVGGMLGLAVVLTGPANEGRGIVRGLAALGVIVFGGGLYIVVPLAAIFILVHIAMIVVVTVRRLLER